MGLLVRYQLGNRIIGVIVLLFQGIPEIGMGMRNNEHKTRGQVNNQKHFFLTEPQR